MAHRNGSDEYHFHVDDLLIQLNSCIWGSDNPQGFV